MSSYEFSEWMAYYKIEPFGEERADLRQALTTSAVANNLQAKAKKPKWTKPEDFMLFREMNTLTQEPKRESASSPEHILAKFNSLTSKKKG